MNHGWRYITSDECFSSITPKCKIEKKNYSNGSLIPIISQEEDFISGYWDNYADITPHSRPIVVFGDHSRVLKYIDFDFVVGADGVKILLPHEPIDAKFLYYFLKWKKIPSLGYSRHFRLLKELKYPCPHSKVQTTVISELDKITELIEVKRSQLKDLDALAQSLFYETFGDPLENSKRWNVGTLSEYASFKNGLNFTPADDGNKIKCLGVGDFKSNRYIKTENLPEINIVEAVSEEYLLKDGDIILVRSNGNKALIGRSIMYVSDNSLATFSGFCIRCRYNREKLAPLFLSYYLSCGAIREYITSQGRGCNISNLNQKILSGIPLILPPLSLQNEFAEKIEAIEGQKRLIESSIADLETLLASRMDYWFTEI